MFLFITLALFVDTLIPINGRPVIVQIGNNTITVDGFKEIKDFLIQMHESSPELHNYNWETFWGGIATAFLMACALSTVFFCIAVCLKHCCKISEKGKKYEAATIGFILGVTGVCDVIHAAKTPFTIDKAEYLGLDDSKAYNAFICIFGGTFVGFMFALSLAVLGNRYQTEIPETVKPKVMRTTFWGPSYGQLVGTIMFTAGNKITGFEMDRALIALCGCLVSSVIGCTILLFFYKVFDDDWIQSPWRQNDTETETIRTKIHEICIGGSIAMASLFYMVSDIGLFG